MYGGMLHNVDRSGVHIRHISNRGAKYSQNFIPYMYPFMPISNDMPLKGLMCLKW